MTKDQSPSPATSEHREPVRFLVFASSRRAASYNAQLAALAAELIRAHDGTVDSGGMEEFDCPSFDQDVQDSDGLPPGAHRLCQRIEANDAIVIASPEYNASIPGLLKNAIDWASRKRPQPFQEKHILLLSASPSMVGGNRGLWALRVPLEHLGARVYPEMFSLAQAHQGFDASGQLSDRTLHRRLERTIVAFMDLVEASKHYPCAKNAWIEFLGEHAGPAPDAGG